MKGLLRQHPGVLSLAAEKCGLTDYLISEADHRWRLFGRSASYQEASAVADLAWTKPHEKHVKTILCWMIMQAERPVHVPPLESYLRDLMRQVVTHGRRVLLEAGCLKLEHGTVSWLRTHLGSSVLSNHDRRAILLKKFPRKPHPQAGTKVNVFLDEVLNDLHTWDLGTWTYIVDTLSLIRDGSLTEDQACACVVYAVAMTPSVTLGDAFWYAVISCLENERSKAFSDILKSVGWNHCKLGSMLVEGACLQGRGVGVSDLEEDIERRCRKGGCPVVDCDQKELGRVVRAILQEELGHDRVAVDTAQRHFVTRFSWCVAGSHSRGANRHPVFSRLPKVPLTGGRWDRRMVSEWLESDPVETWDGTVGVSPSLKLEQGKARPIYSCDTVSYFAFSRLLRPIEAAWQGRRVILDPGRGGSRGMDARLSALAQGGYMYYVALDYADFNSQHSIESQKTVIRETIACTVGLEDELADKLVNSFDNMDIYYLGAHRGRVASSLMSGHRATSYINSILNAAYIRMAIGTEAYIRNHFLHVGDDVAQIARTPGDADTSVDGLTRLGCTMVPSKQSVGRAGYEFLRMAGNRDSVFGYLARAVAAAVSGNWVTTDRPQGRDGIMSFVNMVRSITNRGTSPNVYRLFVGSLHQNTGIGSEVAALILRGDVAVDTGPCYRSDGRYVSVQLDEERETRGESVAWDWLYCNATRDYFTFGLSNVERRAVSLVGFLPWAAALRSSFGDLAVYPSGIVGGRKAVAVSGFKSRVCAKVGQVALSSLQQGDVKHGLLAHHNVVSLLKNVLSVAALRELLVLQGGSYIPGREYIDAFGAEREGVTVVGSLPYSEAAALSQYEIGGAIWADKPIEA